MGNIKNMGSVVNQGRLCWSSFLINSLSYQCVFVFPDRQNCDSGSAGYSLTTVTVRCREDWNTCRERPKKKLVENANQLKILLDTKRDYKALMSSKLKRPLLRFSSVHIHTVHASTTLQHSIQRTSSRCHTQKTPVLPSRALGCKCAKTYQCQ